VRGTARRLASYGLEGDRITLMLNRQAAHAGTLVLCGQEDESPLGPLYLTITSPDTEKLVEWLTAYPGSG
jgi:predicted RNA binding protein with dsRBD fold (UPF0201 family)